VRAARDLLYYLYVVDREHRLVGVLDIPELLLARARDPVSAVMHRHVDRVSAFLPVALVRAHAGWQQYHALPVVDEEDRLLGAIRYQTLRRLERDASDRGPDPAHLTAGALAELFQLGTTGLVTGVAGVASTSASASASASADPDRPVAADEEVPDEE
ncbi:MAG: CBS domain-containing protein, partial [Gemmatimonadaceae bacterium]